MTQAVEKMPVQIEGPVSQVPMLQSEGAAVLGMIERAARDPSVDINKLQQLMEMRERIEARNAEAAFDRALTAAQAGMVRVRTDSNNPQTKSRYASYGALDAAMRPIYTGAGFALSFNTENPAPEIVRVICRVSHQGGHSRTYQIDMPADGKGAKGGDVMTKTHATGSAVSYGMRYLLKMIFNIAVSDKDDDGNAAANGGTAINRGPDRDAYRTDRKRRCRQGAVPEIFQGRAVGRASEQALPGSRQHAQCQGEGLSMALRIITCEQGSSRNGLRRALAFRPPLSFPRSSPRARMAERV
jgi:hypothetical protein